MNRLRLLLPLLLGSAPQALSSDQDALMHRIEAAIVMPTRAAPLSSYGRYYAWETRGDGVRKILAIYIRERDPQRHWVNQNELPLVMDGGCDIVSLTFDLASDRIERVECNGEG